MKRLPRIVSAGDRAMVVELDDAIDPAVNAKVRALAHALEETPLPGQVDCVPTLRSLLLVFDREPPSEQAVFEHIASRGARSLPAPAPPRSHVVPVRYGGDDGPDLAEIAARLGTSAGVVARLHESAEYTALMLGFMPGFAYLGMLPPALTLPRRATPRTQVPAGSVAIAGSLTACYPRASPGGWHLLGRAALPFFDPTRDPPAAILPGDTVRFAATDEILAAANGDSFAAGAGEPFAEIDEPGLLTTVQDLGRVGYRRYAIGAAGAMDGDALRAANAAVGNSATDAGLECTLAGPVLRFTASVQFAVTGADLGAVLERSDLGRWPVPLGQAVRARAGNVLRFEGRRAGARAYVAIAGGIDVPPVMGSRATDVAAGLGGFHGRALRAADVLRRGSVWREPPPYGAALRELADVVTVRLRPGPQAGALDAPSLARLLDSEYTVGLESDRIGFRLEGPELRVQGSAEVVSDGVPPGAIEVPPDGRPIVLSVEAPTTGGYVKPFVVCHDDLPKLAQLVPGQGRVRFRWIDDD